MPWGVAAAVGGAYISSQGAKSAANSQAGATAGANALSQDQYFLERSDNAPFLSNGTAGNNTLASMLGLSQKALSRAQVEQQLRGQGYGYVTGKSGKQYFVQSKLNNAVNNFLAQQQQQQAIQQKTIDSGQFGSLVKPFSQADLNNDVVYNTGLKFGLDQGTQGINRQAAATGGLLSGATLKALTRFGNDYGNTKAGDAYSRDTATKSNIYNRLAGISGSGQQAVAQAAQSGQNYAGTVGNNLTSLGNARGASAIAGSNAFGNALTNGANYYQNQQLVNGLGQNNPYGGLGYSSADIQGLQGYQGIY